CGSAHVRNSLLFDVLLVVNHGATLLEIGALLGGKTTEPMEVGSVDVSVVKVRAVDIGTDVTQQRRAEIETTKIGSVEVGMRSVPQSLLHCCFQLFPSFLLLLQRWAFSFGHR